jgi:hypothetical protein
MNSARKAELDLRGVLCDNAASSSIWAMRERRAKSRMEAGMSFRRLGRSGQRTGR